MEHSNEETNNQNPENNPIENQEIQISQDKLNTYMEKLKLEQNLVFGIVAGLIAAIGSALIWAAITVSTEYQIGYMAIAVGFLVGFSIRFVGKGISQIFGIVGGVLALLGCLLGNLFSIIGFLANTYEMGYIETLGHIDFGAIPSIMAETFSPIDLLFYGIAIFAGYKYSFREISEEDVIENASA